jgi:UDPglucose 6-dehydrogenase
MNLAVIGTGYVGLVAGACFAESGNNVVCVDIDAAKIEKLNEGVLPIFEPGLDVIVDRNVKERRLRFTTDLEAAVGRASVVFLAVGTPPLEDGSADLRFVHEAARGIGRSMKDRTIVVIKSTVPIGTSERVRAIISEETTHELAMASNPEFMKEGAAVEDFLRPDRVIIGADVQWVKDVLAELYEPFVRTENPILFMDIKSAELSKYASNAMLATRISFMNEIASIAEALGADVSAVRRGMGTDPRIGRRFLFPGVGYGGSCFPKDIKALIGMGKELELPLTLLNAVDEVNERQKKLLVDKMLAHYGGDLSGKMFAVWGLAFKPNTDDMREAPSIVIIESLLELGADVVAFDPVAHDTARQVFGDRIRYASGNYAALEGADALVVVTEWSEFRAPDFAAMKRLLAAPVIFDGRNIYSPEKMRDMGFTYSCIGRV